MSEVWYVMTDGSVGAPVEISAGPDGVLRHADGREVAYKPHGPRARMVDAAAERARMAKPAAKEVKPAATTGTYRTRETKAG